MSASISRAQLLSRSAKGGAALLVAGSALGQLVDTAAAAPLPVSDLAYTRLLVGAELLAADFYAQAIAAANAGASVARYLKIAAFNEQEHYQAVARVLTGAGLTPAVAGDFEFSYPDGTFDTVGSIVTFGLQLETTILGAYLGALGAVQTDTVRTGIAPIAACEAQHAAYFAEVKGLKAFGLSFPPALTIDQASNAFDAYTA